MRPAMKAMALVFLWLDKECRACNMPSVTGLQEDGSPMPTDAEVLELPRVRKEDQLVLRGGSWRIV